MAVVLRCSGMWDCLTHASVISRSKAWTAELALEGAGCVDTHTVGTGSGISALVYICLSGMMQRRSHYLHANVQSQLRFLGSGAGKYGYFVTVLPPFNHGSKQIGLDRIVPLCNPITCAQKLVHACHLRIGLSRTWQSRCCIHRCRIPLC